MKRALVVLVAALLLAGCVRKAEVPTGGEVTVTVSTDFGETRMAPTRQQTAGEDDTVLGLLDRTFEVRADGATVEEIDGVSAGRENGKPVAWFSYVNGIATPEGAATRQLYAGDRIWYDHHGRTPGSEVGAVVGSFPEPFKSGLGGKRFPIRLVCLSGEVRSCDEVATRLETAGVGGISRSNLESSPGEVLRILVGRWTEVRKDITARTLEQGPGVSGVFARPASSGAEIAVLDADGEVGRTLGAGAGLVAATAFREERPTWLVTGTDDVGVAAAAAALTEDMLRFRFALAIEAGRGVALPLEGP